MSTQITQARSIYRRILRELPSRSPSILANPSPVQSHVRADFVSLPASQRRGMQDRLDEAEQYVTYLRAQRMYTTLLERYNPGMNMNEEERVGMDVPVEFTGGGGGGKK